ncbi:MAG: glycosyltransferase, partial [Gammaproteobacteria bacterium]|nr:glycosyltransferase [Gemmatimonadota bacterium]NIU73863.1 glycosyltransferase [Gammaproteobacteria bacterium]NIY08167.1 glycosyltransferase [Gemmatimonadota bacterium]
DEARRLPALLDDLQTLRAPPPAGIGPVEVVVADGGSSDGTPELARAAGARVVAGWTGRGTQLRAGADVASGDWLLFLHADCRLDDVAIRALRGFLASAGPDDFAHFAFR